MTPNHPDYHDKQLLLRLVVVVLLLVLLVALVAVVVDLEQEAQESVFKPGHRSS